MAPSVSLLTSPVERAFPHAELERRLQGELQQAADESAILHRAWEPVLDSLRMVSVVLTLEDLFPFPLPPEKVVRRGGYGSVDEGAADMSARLERLWNEHHRREVRS